jgi:hypothetical protein
MERMAAGPPPLRRAALLVGGAFAVHQLRFVLSYGDDAGKVLSEHGHEYLPFAAAAACVLLLLAVSQFGRSLVRAARGCEPERRAAELRGLWIENALALVAVYVVQEGLEGAFAAGHPVWAHGGWTVVPLAIAAGGLVALLLVSADRALAAVARRRETVHERWSLEWDPPRPASASLVPRDFVARHLAGRAPPRTGLV